MYSKGHVSTIRRQITLEKNGSRTFGTENGSVFRDTRSRIWFMATLNKSWSPELRWREIEENRVERRWETSPISYSMPSYKYYITSLLSSYAVSTDTLLMFIERRRRALVRGGFWPNVLAFGWSYRGGEAVPEVVYSARGCIESRLSLLNIKQTRYGQHLWISLHTRKPTKNHLLSNKKDHKVMHKNIDLKARGNYGMTLLNFTCMKGHTDVVQLVTFLLLDYKRVF